MDKDKSVILDPYLAEAIASNKNRMDICMLLFQCGKSQLLATAIEDAFVMWQFVLEKYCIIEGEDASDKLV